MFQIEVSAFYRKDVCMRVWSAVGVFAARQDAEFGLISCGLVVTIAPGREYSSLTDLP